MKTKCNSFFLLVLLFFFTLNTSSQDLWKKISKEVYDAQKKEIRSFKNFPTKHSLYELDVDEIRNSLNIYSKSFSKIIILPNSAGGLEAFKIRESSIFEKPLADKFPNIKSYTAVGIDNANSYAKISLGLDGFHAVVFSPNGKTIYIDPYSRDNKDYIVYKTSDLKEEDVNFKCKIEETTKVQKFTNIQSKILTDGNLRTFRLALVCSGEYAQFHLNNQSIPTSANEATKKEAVLSAMNTSMTRVNGVFEKDLAVTMVIVGNNDDVIFLDAATDGITDGDPNAMIGEVQTIADSQIGTANYDIGHIFSIDGSGLASLGVVCRTGQKARGVTGRSSPIGDPYDIDYVAHEMGHQFGATHTQNNDCNRTNSTAVEPGSASTIMGYAGICSPNVQSISDAYFHAVSIAQMQVIIATSGSCATPISNGNNIPLADAGINYSIPKATPFILKGSATDVDGTSALTYNWEQIDNEAATMPPLSNNTGGPMFRSLPSTISPNRYMPALTTVLAGDTSSEWEVLPSIARDLNFSLLVRDNYNNGGGTSRDDMLVTVEDAEAFNVTSQNIPIIWDAGSSQTITWSKGTSDIAPINCQNVTIKLSEDGGLTFPIVLSANTVNDGSEVVIVPNNVTTQARIMIEAVDNIFYNINTVNFEIQSTVPSFILKNNSGDLSACNTINQTVDYTLNLDFINGFMETVSFATTGQPEGSSVTFSPSTINEDGNVIMSISNLDGIIAQDYTINIEGNSTSVNQNIVVKLGITDSDLETVILVSPTDGATGISLSDTLIWEAETNASFYVVEIANDDAFTEVIAIGEPTTNAFNLINLDGNTTYYWRVKAKNSCNEGSFSSSFSFTTEIPSYCTSTFTDEAGGTEHITNVTFNAINNDSGNNTSGGYEDFTDINTDVLREISYTVSVTFDTGGYQDHCYVFIDWNQDFVFDKDTERYDLGSKLDDVSTATLSIKVPLDAQFGKTRMRVLIEYDDPNNNYGDGPCDADHLTEWGETEDYSITIIDNTASIEDIAFEGFNLYPNPTKGEFKLNLTLVNTDKVSVQLYDVRGRLIDEKNYYNTVANFSESILFKEASSGLYLLKVINGALQTTRKLIIK
jgi:hypothetical protein